MKNDCPIVSVRRCARSRAAMSGAPPGGIVTSTLTGRVGYCWAVAALASNDANARATTAMFDNFIPYLPDRRDIIIEIADGDSAGLRHLALPNSVRRSAIGGRHGSQSTPRDHRPRRQRQGN